MIRVSMIRKAQKISDKILAFVPDDVRSNLRPILKELGTELFPIEEGTSLVLPHKKYWQLQDEVEGFVDFLDGHNKLKLGRCINNAKEMLALAQFNLRPVMYRGWVIFYTKLGCIIDFHCWVQTSGIIVDPSFDFTFATSMMSRDDLSDDEAADLYQKTKSELPLSKRCIIGSVPHGLIYIGQPTDFDEASASFSYWFHKIAKPRGLRVSKNEFERSQFQEKIENG